jgi:hypothetical protein
MLISAYTDILSLYLISKLGKVPDDHTKAPANNTRHTANGRVKVTERLGFKLGRH